VGVAYGRHDGGGNKAMNRTIVSYPGSGRTWLRVVIGKLCSLQNGTSDKDLFRTPGYNFFHILPPEGLMGRNLFLLRDPKDVLKSSYYEYKYRLKRGADDIGTFSEFLRGPAGASQITRRYNNWHDVWEKDSISGVEFYEDIVADPIGEFSDLLDWFGQEYKPMDLAEAVKFAEFENLRRLSKEQYFNSTYLNAENPNDARTYKFRVGRVGEGNAFIPEEDMEYVEKTFSKIKWSRYRG